MSDSRVPQTAVFQSEILANASDSFTSRRKVIGTLGMATSALCASSLSASAGWFGKKKDELPIVKVNSASRSISSPSQNIGGFPQEWVRLQGRNLNEYAAYLNSLKMKNISAQDVISAHAKQRGTVWNSLPPREWWTRMGYTLRVVDHISTVMNVPVKEIVSAYRSPQYNARCAGAKARSWHQANVAVDVQFETSAYNVTKAARSLRDRGLFKGGVGSYSTFTHVDTRGQNVNW
ncbi:D-Ala-D-Ala carboxypeptidase family metallohydrolase [Luteolibacter algae]|uniref:D-Ala-D-Ala carboxypeptidase family metallohydrolase n=1 Tax=Luteolibacter algae TaxID=454151 RepID=A0ABW5D8T2_9BACT